VRRQRLPFSTAPAALLWSQLCLKPPVNSEVDSYTSWLHCSTVFSQSRPIINDMEFPFIAGLQKSLLENVGLYGGFRFLVSGCTKVDFVVGGGFRSYLGSGFRWLGSGFRASDWISWISWISLFTQTDHAMHRTPQNCRCCIQLGYRQIVLAKKASNIIMCPMKFSNIVHLHISFKVICLCVIRKPLIIIELVPSSGHCAMRLVPENGFLWLEFHQEIQEAQLPQRNSSSAAHVEGG